MSNSLIPLPADLPENWEFDNIIAPNGSDIGMPVQYGYNYVMQQLNNTQKALNGFSGDIGKDYQSLLAALALRYSKEEVDALLSQHNLAEASHPYILSLLANKVDVGTPQVYDIPFINGFERVTSCIFFKIPNGLAVATFRVKLRNWEAIPAGDYIIAELPPGFRTKYLYHESGIMSGSSATVGLTMRGGGLIGMGTTQAVPAGAGASFAGTLVYLTDN